MLKLVKASQKYLPAVLKVLDEYREDDRPYGRGSVVSLIDAADRNAAHLWLEQKQNEDQGIGLKPGYVASTYYWLMDGDDYIGSFTLRHNLTPNLMQIGGNIGYIILPSKRRQGYAFSGLILCLKEAKKLGLDRVLITCNTKNTASFAVITKAMRHFGGEMLPDITIDDECEHRVWVNTLA